MPPVNRLYEEYRGKGLEVLLVSFRERADLVRRTVKERGYTAPVLLDASGETTGVKYGVFGPPTMYLIDREGQLLARGAGPQAWSSPEARKLLEAVLAAR